MNLTELLIIRKINDNRGLLLKIAVNLGITLESLGYSEEDLLEWETRRKIPQFFRKDPKKYSEILRDLQTVCKILLERLLDQSPGYEIYNIIEENEDLFLLNYDITHSPTQSLPHGRWKNIQEIYDYLKNQGFEHGLNPIPKYKNLDKKRLNEPLNDVIKSLEYTITWTEKRVEGLQKELKKVELHERKMEEYHNFINMKLKS